MKRYVAFLRGINISGKNKIPMADLKKNFEALGFTDVKTYLNSGNVIFSADNMDETSLTALIENMIKEQFGFDIPVFIILQSNLADIIDNSPEWWGSADKEIYDNLIFILPPKTFQEVYNALSEPKAELETIMEYNNAVFWSFNLKNYQKTNWWSKTASCEISNFLTIRTANTVKKIVSM